MFASLKGPKVESLSDTASTFSSATTSKLDGASEYTLTPDATEKKKSGLKGALEKLERKKDAVMEHTPVGRSNAIMKQRKEEGKKNDPMQNILPLSPRMFG